MFLFNKSQKNISLSIGNSVITIGPESIIPLDTLSLAEVEKIKDSVKHFPDVSIEYDVSQQMKALKQEFVEILVLKLGELKEQIKKELIDELSVKDKPEPSVKPASPKKDKLEKKDGVE